MKVCCISDTHEMHERLQIPPCDLLVHAGDITFHGNPERVRDFDRWCHTLIEAGITKGAVCIAGNHDFVFEQKPALGRSCLKTVQYLEDSCTAIAGIRIYGTPWQPWFYDWAFNLKGEDELKKKFDLIPPNLDILICHSPPAGILSHNAEGEDCGSTSLLETIYRVRPRLVVFGHIHESYGVEVHDGITFVNASVCTLEYEPVNLPVVVELDILREE